MSERESFIRAIVENPEDNTVRLVFADWLQENGESERAEFIRDGVAVCYPECLAPDHDMGGSWQGWDGIVDIIAQYPPQERDHCPLCRAIDNQRNSRCRRRIAEEIGAIVDMPVDWSGRKDPGSNYCGVRCRAGFAHTISLPCAEFLKHAEAIFRAHPVTSVRLTDLQTQRRRYWDGSSIMEPPFDENIPGELFQLMCEMFPEKRDSVGDSVVEFKDDVEAHDALSDVAVAYGRKLAGLPPLPTLTPVA